MKLLVMILLFVGLSTGCSAINKMMYESKCNSGDWETLGFSDGKLGKSNGDIMSWNERCQQFNTKPDSKTYMKGVALGITDFCKNQGMQNGSSGKASSVPSQCTSTVNSRAYKSAFSNGVAEYCNYENGLKAGQAGKDKPKSCVKYSSYNNAYKVGLGEHCSEKNAYDVGVSKAKSYYFKNCPTRDQSSLQKAFADGKAVGGLKNKIATLDKEIAGLESKMYDSKIPSDAKTHYRNILTEKKRVLRDTERELYSKERR